VIFQEDEAAQRNGDILGYFYLKQKLLHFHHSKTWFVVGITWVQKWFNIDVLDLQIELWCRFFDLDTVLATFNKVGIFFKSSGHPEG